MCTTHIACAWVLRGTQVGLTGFSCKCQPDAVFCSTHRYAEAHACAFDYKSLQKQRLEALNPQVQASKVQKL